MNYENYLGKKVVVRSNMAGVFYGVLNQIEPIKDSPFFRVELKDSIRIFYWEGANSLSDLAINGVAKPNDCKFLPPIKEHLVGDICEIIKTEEKAQKSIEKVKVWVFGNK